MAQVGSPAYCEPMLQPMLPFSASSEKTVPVPGGGAARTVSANVTLCEAPPACSDADAGETATEKSGCAAAVTVRVSVDECVSPPAVPVTVIFDEPAGAPAATASDSVDDPEPVTLAGENEALTPDGRPL